MFELEKVSSDKVEDKAKEVIEHFEKAKQRRTNWDNYWSIISQYVVPLKDNIYGAAVHGTDKHNRLFDSTSVHANELLASALHSMLTNPSSTWFGLSTGEDKLDEVKEIRQWLQDATNKVMRTLNSSNFQEEIHEIYLDLGSFGTGLLFMHEDDEKKVRFEANQVYTAWLEENNTGEIDGLYRVYKYNLRQIIMEFGREVMTDELIEELKGNGDSKFEIIHAIFPMENSEKFNSIHVLREKALLLREASYNEKPFAAPRWIKLSGESYGRSPAMKALPDIKMLNQMQRTLIRAAQKAVDPPIMVPDNGFLMPIKTTPSGVNIYRAGTKDKIESFPNTARVDIGLEMIKETRMRIRESFFIDQLQLQDGPQMTATEVMQRTEEKLRVMGPILGRLHSELLRPIIDRVFNMLYRKKELGEIPKQLKGKQLDIKYVSQISRAQRASEADTLQRVIQSVGALAQVDPTMLQAINGEEALRYNAQIFGLPEGMLRSREEMENSRQQAAESQSKMMQNEQDNVVADTQQKLAKTQQ